MAEAQESGKASSEKSAEADQAGGKSKEEKLADLARLLPEFPDIFESRPELLDDLNLHHNTGGAVSLIERQVRQLRDSNATLREQLQTLLATARDNEQRVSSLNRLACALLETGSVEALFDTLGRHLKEDFGICRWALYQEQIEVLEGLSHSHPLPESGPTRTALENSLRTSKVECMAMNDELGEALFQTVIPAGSVAIIPLLQLDPNALLVLASEDGEKFQPEAGSLMLDMLGELVSAALKRYSTG